MDFSLDMFELLGVFGMVTADGMVAGGSGKVDTLPTTSSSSRLRLARVVIAYHTLHVKDL